MKTYALALFAFIVLTVSSCIDIVTMTKPNKPVEVVMPSSAPVAQHNFKTGIFIKLNKENNVSYKYNDSTNKNEYQNLPTNSIAEIVKALDNISAKYKIVLTETPITIIGDKVASFPALKNIIDALKQIDMMKFDIITDPQKAVDDSSMKLFVPKDYDLPHIKISQTTLTIFIVDETHLYSFIGIDKTKGKMYSGDIVVNAKEFISEYKSKINQSQQQIIIKSFENASFNNLTDLLDQMTKINIKKFSLEDVTDDDIAFISTLELK